MHQCKWNVRTENTKTHERKTEVIIHQRGKILMIFYCARGAIWLVFHNFCIYIFNCLFEKYTTQMKRHHLCAVLMPEPWTHGTNVALRVRLLCKCCVSHWQLCKYTVIIIMHICHTFTRHAWKACEKSTRYRINEDFSLDAKSFFFHFPGSVERSEKKYCSAEEMRKKTIPSSRV